MTDARPAPLRLPALRLAGSDGATHDLAEFLGKPLVVYVYPRDNTPGCTTEACDFRDHHAAFAAAGARVVGVSPDSVASHQGFVGKHGLPFLLLADPDKALCTALGAYGEKVMYGKKVLGIIRSTFLFAADGGLVKAWRKVTVDGHAGEVLEAVRAL